MFFKDKKIVITGGAGMIGTHYIKELLNRGAKVRNQNLFNVFPELINLKKKEV